MQLDHICYRVETKDEYQELYHQLVKEGADLLVEDSINGRLISTFKLQNPIIVDDREIYLLELPMPKNGSPYHSGWEHAEFVVGILYSIVSCQLLGPDVDLIEFSKRYPNLSLEWDLSGSSKASNPDVRIELISTFVGKMSAKFHHLSLDRVIELEKAGKSKCLP